MKKRLLACLLSMLMLVGMVPVSVSAADVTGKVTVNGTDYDTLLAAVEASKNETKPVTMTITGTVEWETGAGHGSTPFGMITPVLTIKGADANAKLVATGAGVGPIGQETGKVVFQNLTIQDESVSYAENSWEFGYLEFCGNLEFNKVTFTDAIQIDHDNGNNANKTVTFTDCSFTSRDKTQYSVWIGDGTAVFTNCTFSGYRGLKMHEDYGSNVTSVTVTGCTFGPLSEKPGIAIGTVDATTMVTLTNNTVNGVQAGDQNQYLIESDTDLSTFNYSAENNSIAVPGAVAQIGTVQYATLDAALGAATERDTVTILPGTYDAFTVPKSASGVTIKGTLDANGNKLTTIKTNEDVYTHNTLSGIYMMADDVTFADLKFTSGKTQKSWMDGAISTYNEKYGNFNSLTIDNCDFVGSGVGFAISAAKQFGDLTITNTTITNYNKGVYIYGLAAGATMTITDSEIEASDRVIHFEESTATSEVVVSGSTLVAPHLSFGGSAVSTINNCEIETTFWIYGDLTITASKLVDCKYNTSSTASITLGSDAATANYISNPDDVAAATEKGENVGPLYPYYQDASRTKLIRSEEDVTAVAYIGETPYQSLEDAINALGGAGTIQLVADCAENITLSLGDAEAYNITITLADGIEFSGSIDAADDDTSVVISTADGLITVAVAAAPKSVVSKPTFDYVLFALAARYSQRFDVLVSAENATVTGDLVIKYKRSGTVDIDVADGYQIVDVIANGQSLGAVESVTFKKVMTDQTLVVVTEPIPTEETPAVNP